MKVGLNSFIALSLIFLTIHYRKRTKYLINFRNRQILSHKTHFDLKYCASFIRMFFFLGVVVVVVGSKWVGGLEIEKKLWEVGVKS